MNKKGHKRNPKEVPLAYEKIAKQRETKRAEVERERNQKFLKEHYLIGDFLVYHKRGQAYISKKNLQVFLDEVKKGIR